MRQLTEKILLPQIKADRAKERWTRSSVIKKLFSIVWAFRLWDTTNAEYGLIIQGFYGKNHVCQKIPP
jgi:hypothetical protein